MDIIRHPVPSPPLEQASPLSHKRLGTRSAAHVLLSEVDESPWLLPRREDRPMKKSVAIRAAISAINTYGILVVPGLVEQRTAAGCAADADAALGESLVAQLIEVGLAVSIAGLAYLGVMHLLRVPEASRIIALVRRRDVEAAA